MYIRGSSRTYPTYEDYKNSGKFTDDQLKWIRKGFDVNLSPRDISLYAQPEYTPDQMEELYDGFNCDLDFRDVLLYANPEFDPYQMNEIKMALWSYELDRDLVARYAKPEFSDIQMNVIRNILYGTVDYFPDSIDELMDLIAHSEYSEMKIKTLYHMWGMHKEPEIIDFIKNLEAEDQVFYWARRGFETGLTLAQVSSYAKPGAGNMWMQDRYYTLQDKR